MASADLLVHVVDGSSPDPARHIDAVRVVLDEIGAGEVPQLVVYNKADIAVPAAREPGSVVTAARTGEGIDKLLVTLGDRLRSLSRIVELRVPYTRGDVLAALHRSGEVLMESHEDDATRVRARLDQADAARFREFRVS